MIKLSVIVPIYNVEKFLGKCLHSIMGQTIGDFEVLAIDDGSTDNSGKIADIFSKKYSNISCIHTENSGYAATCNLGLRIAKGEFISIVEPDDFIDAKMFGDLLKTASKTNADIIKSRYYEFLDYKGVKKEKICGANIITDNAFSLHEHPELLRFHPSIWSCIYKSAFLRENKIIFCENKYNTWQDNLFQIKTLFFASRIAYVNKAYYHWRVTNLFSSEKIKNAAIPISIIEESHKFLALIGCKNPDIFANLHIREMVYFKSAIRTAKLSDLKMLSYAINKYLIEIKQFNIKQSLYYRPKYSIFIMKRSLFLYFALERIKFALSKTLKFIKIRLS